MGAKIRMNLARYFPYLISVLLLVCADPQLCPRHPSLRLCSGMYCSRASRKTVSRVCCVSRCVVALGSFYFLSSPELYFPLSFLTFPNAVQAKLYYGSREGPKASCRYRLYPPPPSPPPPRPRTHAPSRIRTFALGSPRPAGFLITDTVHFKSLTT